MNLFVYGTLIDPDIMMIVCGEVFHLERAFLQGFHCECVRGEVYPAIVADERSFVEGKLCFGVSASVLARIDRYEGEQYIRKEVIVRTESKARLAAQAYVIAPGCMKMLTGEPWFYKQFQTRDKERYLKNMLS